MAVAEQMDFRRESPAGTAQGVIRGLLGSRPCRPRRHTARRARRCRRCTTTRDRPGPRRCRRPATGRGSHPASRRRSRCRRDPRRWPRGRVPRGGRARGAGPEDPEDAVEDLASISRGRPVAGWGEEEVMNEFPLLVRKSMTSQHAEPPWWMCISVHTIMLDRSQFAKTSFLTEPSHAGPGSLVILS